MTAYRNFSIRSKFLVAAIVTVITSLVIALTSIVTLNQRLAAVEFSNQLQVLVDITAERSQAALAFRDKRTINQNLKTLSKLSSIDVACIYTAEGKLFGKYERSSDIKCDDVAFTTPAREEDTAYRASTQLLVKGRPYGHLFVQANGKELDDRLSNFLTYSFTIILFSGLVAYFLALRLQRTVTLPIIRLSKLSQLIGKTRDFSLRAKVYNKDESGTLAQSFNGLIGDIQESQMQMEELVVELQEKTQQLESHTEIVEERNKSIRTMFAGASHDLKQPLQAMTLFVNALYQISSDAQKELVKKLELAINNMRTLFEDLLDVSKLEDRLENVQTEAVSLKPLLDAVFHEFDAMADDKNLALRFHARDFVIDTNARMLERIVRNLLSNSIRYTTRGGVLLACRKRKEHVHIEIWDTGRGIPKESMDSIFKSFYQVERKTVEGQQGYGLGLSIVKRLSEMLRHPIEIKSEFGSGTMFRIIVPLHQSVIASAKSSEIPSAETQHAPANAIRLPQAPLIGGDTDQKIAVLPGDETRVLLIDDDDLVRDSLETLIKSWRMEVFSFDSIDTMTRHFEANPDFEFDVIVSDFQLSATETGFDSIAAARAFGGEAKPALIVTGTTDPELLKQIKESGIRKLKKPVKPAKLRALINHLYSNS